MKHSTRPGTELGHYEASVMHKSQEQQSKGGICPVDYFTAALVNKHEKKEMEDASLFF